jgi:hypothetical protein
MKVVIDGVEYVEEADRQDCYERVLRLQAENERLEEEMALLIRRQTPTFQAKSIPDFQVGDFVRLKEYPEPRYCVLRKLKLGTCGRVVADKGEGIYCGIEFSESFGGHSCGGKTRDGHGYWIEARHLEKVD